MLKAFTLAYKPETGFDDGPLEAFCADHAVHEVFEHFAVVDGHLVWGVLVRYRPRAPAPEAVRAFDSHRPDPRDDLQEADRVVYEALRTWRKQRSQSDGVPVYAVFRNATLAEVARTRPTTLAALATVRGVGDAKAQRFGEEVLAVVGLAAPVPAAPSGVAEPLPALSPRVGDDGAADPDA